MALLLKSVLMGCNSSSAANVAGVDAPRERDLPESFPKAEMQQEDKSHVPLVGDGRDCPEGLCCQPPASHQERKGTRFAGQDDVIEVDRRKQVPKCCFDRHAPPSKSVLRMTGYVGTDLLKVC